VRVTTVKWCDHGWIICTCTFNFWMWICRYLPDTPCYARRYKKSKRLRRVHLA